MNPTYGDLVDAYLADPRPTTLAELRRAVRTARNFDEATGIDDDARRRIAAADWPGVVAALRARMPGGLLSPSVHAELANALRHLGRTAEADREAGLAEAALRSILATGAGTAESPWSVLRVSDEYDVVSATGARPTGQELVTVGGRQVDRITCADGTVLHFDASALVGSQP